MRNLPGSCRLLRARARRFLSEGRRLTGDLSGAVETLEEGWMELEGRESAALAVAELRRECPSLRVLGSYPARTTADGAVDRM